MKIKKFKISAINFVDHPLSIHLSSHWCPFTLPPHLIGPCNYSTVVIFWSIKYDPVTHSLALKSLLTPNSLLIASFNFKLIFYLSNLYIKNTQVKYLIWLTSAPTVSLQAPQPHFSPLHPHIQCCNIFSVMYICMSLCTLDFLSLQQGFPSFPPHKPLFNMQKTA